MTDPEVPGPGDAQRRGEPGDLPDLDIDSAFAAIIADFSTSLPHGLGPWPAIEDLADDDAPANPYDPRDDTLPRRVVLPGEEFRDQRAERRKAQDRAEAAEPVGDPHDSPHEGSADGSVNEVDEDDDEGFVPPVPPPIPRGDIVARLAWGAVIGGPLFLLAAALAWRDLPSILLLLALVAFVGGFITLVARMPQDPPDDPDDGAVV